jgi:hypothetical protein
LEADMEMEAAKATEAGLSVKEDELRAWWVSS